MSPTSALTRPATLPHHHLDGKVVLPGDDRFDQARRAWNLVVDQRPAAVAFPESAADVAAAIRYAARRGWRVAAQGTGHNAGPLGPLADTMLVRTGKMRGIQIDPQARTARAEAGVVWIDVVEAAARHGLAALAGSSPDVGVTGYTLGGGLSFLGRKYGLAADNVVAAEMVTADGRLIRADADHEPDLFWALRGGGGSFGVVTALEFRLFPHTQAYAGALWYPIGRASEVLHAWAELTRGPVPDELTTIGRLLNFPPIPQIPEQIRGQSFVIVEAYHLGDPAQADALLGPLRALGPVNDTITTVPVPALSHLHMDPEQPVSGAGDGMMTGPLPAEAIDALVQASGPGAAFPLLSVEVRHLGGEFARPRPGNGALASLNADYVLFAVSMTPVPDLVAPVMAQVQAIKDALAPWAAPQMYLNYAETQIPAASFWTEHAYQRLRRIKAAADPGNLIRANHPIPPAAR
jgi:FAD binding domain/Berberine and berberine like